MCRVDGFGSDDEFGIVVFRSGHLPAARRFPQKLWKTLWKRHRVYGAVTRNSECFSGLHHRRASHAQPRPSTARKPCGLYCSDGVRRVFLFCAAMLGRDVAMARTSPGATRSGHRRRGVARRGQKVVRRQLRRLPRRNRCGDGTRGRKAQAAAAESRGRRPGSTGQLTARSSSSSATASKKPV